MAEVVTKPVSRVTLVVGSLSGGGIARVATIMANYWADRDWELSIVTLDSSSTGSHYEIHPEVEVRYADLVGDSRGKVDATVRNLRRLLRLRRIISGTSPDSVIAFGDQINVLVLLALAGTGVPVIVSQRVDPRRHSIGSVWSMLRRVSYSLATWIVVQTSSVQKTSPERFREKTVTIPNPVPIPQTFASSGTSPRPKPIVVAMGRLTRQKGFDLLLEAFARIAKRRLDWSLVIWGEGPARPELEELCVRLELSDRVRFAGQAADPASELAAADLFVLPSRFEGFPNVLCEAMAIGLPVVATECDSGPADIVRSGQDGLLVPVEDVDALVLAMDELMGDDKLRASLGKNARGIVDRFSVPRIMSSWEQLVSQVP